MLRQAALGPEWLAEILAPALTSYATFIKQFDFSVSVSSSVKSKFLSESDHRPYIKCLQHHQVSTCA